MVLMPDRESYDSFSQHYRRTLLQGPATHQGPSRQVQELSRTVPHLEDKTLLPPQELPPYVKLVLERDFPDPEKVTGTNVFLGTNNNYRRGQIQVADEVGSMLQLRDKPLYDSLPDFVDHRSLHVWAPAGSQNGLAELYLSTKIKHRPEKVDGRQKTESSSFGIIKAIALDFSHPFVFLDAILDQAKSFECIDPELSVGDSFLDPEGNYPTDTTWLYRGSAWKPITAQPMDETRTRVLGNPVEVLSPDPSRPETVLIEAAERINAYGMPYLFVSGPGCWTNYKIMQSRFNLEKRAFEFPPLPEEGQVDLTTVVDSTNNYIFPGHPVIYREETDREDKCTVVFAAIPAYRSIEEKQLDHHTPHHRVRYVYKVKLCLREDGWWELDKNWVW